jgi:hypothetical protein
MPVRVVWKFPPRVPSINGQDVLVEEADELWWQLPDIAQLYAVLRMKELGAVGFRLEPADA